MFLFSLTCLVTTVFQLHSSLPPFLTLLIYTCTTVVKILPRSVEEKIQKTRRKNWSEGVARRGVPAAPVGCIGARGASRWLSRRCALREWAWARPADALSWWRVRANLQWKLAYPWAKIPWAPIVLSITARWELAKSRCITSDFLLKVLARSVELMRIARRLYRNASN